MQPTPRLSVLSDKIPRVGGSHGNEWEAERERMGGRAGTNRNEWEAERARGQGARPPPLGARPATRTNEVPSHGLCSTDLKD